MTMSEFLLYLMESALCLSFFYGFYWLFLKNETFFALNRFYLITALLASYAIPLLNLPSPFRTRPVTPVTDAMLSEPAGAAAGFGAGEILLAVYLLGAGFVLLRFGYQLFGLARLILRSGVIRRNGCCFVITQENNTPFSFFNLIFLKRSEFDDNQFHRILTHERVHIKQQHSIDVFIMEIASAFQWFNPFVWPYKKSLKETHEYLADNAVIAQGGDRAEYQLLILEQQVGMKLFEFANNFKHSQIKRRITMMTKNKSKKGARFKLLLILPITCFLLLAFAEPRPVLTSPTLQPVDSGVNPVSFQEKTLSEEQQKKPEQQKKMQVLEKRKAIELKMAQIKEAAENTDDEDKRLELKAAYTKLRLSLKENGVEDDKWIKIKKKTADGEEKVYKIREENMKEVEKLKLMYEKTDDPELKKKIKQKVSDIMEKNAEIVTETYSADQIKNNIKKLETMLKETNDSDKKAKIKEKLVSLYALLEKHP